MSFRAKLLTKHLKRHDKDLFADLSARGTCCVFRRVHRFEPVIDSEDFVLLALKEDRQFVFALTDTWGMAGKPRDWGIDVVINRVKEHDTQNNEAIFRQIEEQDEKIEEAKKRHFRNESEAFLKDFRKTFARATNDILTHSIAKKDNRRIGEKKLNRRLKNGNY